MHTAVTPKLFMSVHAYDSGDGSEEALHQQLKPALSTLVSEINGAQPQPGQCAGCAHMLVLLATLTGRLAGMLV